MTRKIMALGGVAVAALLHAGVAQAQSGQTDAAAAGPSDQLAEVVVTAERRETNLQKAAVSVTALEGRQIEASGRTSFEKVLQNVPSVQMAPQGGPFAGSPNIAIRGLGTDGVNKPPSTTVYLDGVTLNGQGAQFYDLARVEVLRGPQGTLYGGVATAGAVNVITNDPRLKEFEGSAQLDVGNHGLLHGTAMVNAPISDTLALRVGFNGQDRNLYYGGNSGFKEFNTRAKLLFKPNDTISLVPMFEYYKMSGVSPDAVSVQNNAGDLVGQPFPYYGYGSLRVSKYAVTLNVDLGPAVLTYIPAYQHLSSDLPLSNNAPGLSSAETNLFHQDVTTQELRFANAPGSRVSWVVGGYFKRMAASSVVNIGTDTRLPPTPFISVPEKRDFKSYAGFAQFTVPVTDALRLTGGLRYSADKIDHVQLFTNVLGLPFLPPTALTAFHKTFYSTDFLVRGEADLSPRNLVYASASTGYRPGGLAVNGASYGVERVKAYELGSKNRFLDNRLQLNGAVYYNNYPSFQNQATVYLPGNAQLATVVAVPARFYGFELEAVALLSAADRLTMSLSLESAKYTGNGSHTSVSPNGSFVTSILPTDGGTVPHAPGTTLSADYQHTFDLGERGSLTASLTGNYRSKQYISFDSCLYDPTACATTSVGKLTQKGYALFDASLAYSPSGSHYTLSLYGRNLGKKTYKFGYNTSLAVLGTPRTFGVIVAGRF